MDWITIIESLLPLLSENFGGAGADAAELSDIALKLIQRIKSQSGMTTEEILARADLTVAQNKIKLAEDAARLGPGGGAGGGGGTGGGGGAGGGTGGGSGSGTGGNP